MNSTSSCHLGAKSEGNETEREYILIQEAEIQSKS